MLCYSRESAIAEKFEAMIALGELNSRMKDFYDIWLLSRRFDFEGQVLAEAIAQTLANRNTVLPDDISAFSKRFVEAKQVQWRAFHNRLKQDHLPAEFAHIMVAVSSFLQPVIAALRTETPFVGKWVGLAPGFDACTESNRRPADYKSAGRCRILTSQA